MNGNSSVSDVIDQPGDTDWHALDVTAGSEYLISMVSSGDDPLNDPFLVLYDSAGEFITSDDDSAGGFNAAISYLAAADGRIFISAEAFSLTDDAGTYTVTVEPQFGPVARVGSSDSSSESDFML